MTTNTFYLTLSLDILNDSVAVSPNVVTQVKPISYVRAFRKTLEYKYTGVYQDVVIITSPSTWPNHLSARSLFSWSLKWQEVLRAKSGYDFSARLEVDKFLLISSSRVATSEYRPAEHMCILPVDHASQQSRAHNLPMSRKHQRK